MNHDPGAPYRRKDDDSYLSYDAAVMAEKERKRLEAIAAREARQAAIERQKSEADNSSWVDVGSRYLNPLRKLSRAVKRVAYRHAPD